MATASVDRAPVLTTKELARLLKVSETQVRRMNLPAITVGRGRFRYVLDTAAHQMLAQTVGARHRLVEALDRSTALRVTRRPGNPQSPDAIRALVDQLHEHGAIVWALSLSGRPDEVEQQRPVDLGPLFEIGEQRTLTPEELGFDPGPPVDHGQSRITKVDRKRNSITLEYVPPAAPVDTSEAAAVEIQTRTAQIRARILEHLTLCGAFGATEREVEQALALGGNTVRPRLWELEGNAPKGRSRPPRRITKTLRKRKGARVYVALSCGPGIR